MSEDRNAGAFEEHIAAAENYLVMTEDGFTRLYEEPQDGPPEGLSWPGVRGKLEVALQLADLHRRMAETYWTTTPQRIAVSEPAEADIARLREELGAKMDEDAKAFDDIPAPDPPCACCTSGLFTAAGDGTCHDCGHAGDRHNGNAPEEEDPLARINGPGEVALIKAADRAAGAGWRQVADWLTACADCNREGKYWPPLIAAPAGVVMAQRHVRTQPNHDERRKAVQELSDQEFEDMLTLAAEEQARRQTENGVQINARPWKSSGGAGQWNG